MTKKWSVAKITDILLKNWGQWSYLNYLNKILDVHPLAKRCPDNIASVKN